MRLQTGLFLVAPKDVPGPSVVQSSALGAAVEHAVIGRLLEAGRKVAVPVVDDDGVDLVVDYAVKVQVKSCAGLRSRSDGNVKWEFDGRTPGRDGRSHDGNAGRRRVVVADVFVFFAREERIWWVVPAAEVRGSRFKITPGGANDARWRDAWNVFDGF